jgi:type III pantothenate kinase
MNWLFDLGNTRLKWAPFDAGSRGPVEAVAHGSGDFADAVAQALGPAAAGARVWLASVASASLTEGVAARLAGLGYLVVPVHTQARALGVRIAYRDPSRLGVDRFLALLGAHARDDGPWLVVSVGSAMTVDLLDRDGRHHGGLIAPAPLHMRQALGERFPVLANAQGEPHDWATDTGDAVVSGTLAAAAGLVERARRQAAERLGIDPTVVVTGGAGSDVGARLPFATVSAPDLVLEGLARLAAEAT